MTVLFFEKPTIGYCAKCDKVAVYRDKLSCPECGTTDLSIFEWDEESPYPE